MSETTHSSLPIDMAIPTSSTLLVEGSGRLAAQALLAAGQPAAMAVIEPLTGQISPSRTPEEVMTITDPSLKLERAAKPENNMTVHGPSLMNGPGR